MLSSLLFGFLGGRPREANAAPARLVGAGAPCLFSALKEMKGAERRQALVRIRRTRGAPRGRTHLRIAGDDGRIAGRRASRRSAAAFSFGVGPRFRD